jgi:hypothetical protein
MDSTRVRAYMVREARTREGECARENSIGGVENVCMRERECAQENRMCRSEDYNYLSIPHISLTLTLSPL